MWVNRAVPIGGTIASKEVTGSALPTLQGLKAELLREHSVNLDDVTTATVLDGNPGLAQACQLEMSTSKQRDCIVHAKKRVTKKGAFWKYGNKCMLLQQIMEYSAWWDWLQDTARSSKTTLGTNK